MSRFAAWTGLCALALLAPALAPAHADEKGSLQGIETEFKAAITKVTPATVVCIPKGAPKLQLSASVTSSGVLVSKSGLVLSDRDAALVMKPVGEGNRQGLVKSHNADLVEIRVPDVKTGSFRNHTARIIRRLADADSMLLRVTDPPKGGFTSWVSIGSSEDLQVGDFTFAVGNAFGLSKDALPSLTAGVVSSLQPFPAGHAEGKWEWLTSSAAVNPGVNGGPVVDLEGRLVGTVSTYMTAEDPKECGQFLAKVVPIQRLRKLYGDLPEAAELFSEPKPVKPGSTQAAALESAFHAAAQSAYGAVASLVVERTSPLKVCFPTEEGTAQMDRFLGPVSALVASKDGDLVTSLYNLTNTISLVHPPRVGAAVMDEFTLESGLKQITKITACLADGRRYPARLVSYDPHLAVAYLKADVPADATPLPVLKPAPADAFREGRFGLALGNPFGEKPLASPFLTVGILSKVHSATQPYAWRKNWQTDAPATDANCGGALVNLKGELYGMLQIWDPRFHGRASGIGFVVPWTEIEAVLPDLRRGRAWKRAFLGITSDTAERIPKITQIEPRSPAASAGLAVNDRIVAVDGFVPKDVDQMLQALRFRFAGDRVRLTIERPGEKKHLEIDVTLAERPQASPDEGKVPQPTAVPAAAPATVPTAAGPEKAAGPPPEPPAPADPDPPGK